jgi:hypothetical protein
MIKKKTYKGIVIKVTPEYIVLMCQGGTFKNVPRSVSDFPKIGQPFTYKEKEWSGFSKWHYLSMVSVLFLSIIGFTYFSYSQTEEAYVLVIDINPSIEIYADEDFSIIRLQGLNQDGEKIIHSLDPKIKKVNQLVSEIVDQSVKQNFLKKTDKGLVSISVIPLSEKVVQVNQDIQLAVEKSLQVHKIDAKVSVKSETIQVLDKAQELQLSVNKFRLYEELKAEGITIELDALRKQSILQINQLKEADLKERLKQAGEINSSNTKTKNTEVNARQQTLSESGSKNKKEETKKTDHKKVTDENKETSKQQEPQRENNNAVNEQNETVDDDMEEEEKDEIEEIEEIEGDEDSKDDIEENDENETDDVSDEDAEEENDELEDTDEDET